MGNFLTPREKKMLDDAHERSVTKGYWGKDYPFEWMRRLFYWKQGIEAWFKAQKCKKEGHNPGVIWFIDGLPYSPDLDHLGKMECSFVGGGILEFRGKCTKCEDHYTLPWPCKNPDYELTDYVHENYPKAVFIDLRKLKSLTLYEIVNQELERINK